jgi:hypothetical protein
MLIDQMQKKSLQDDTKWKANTERSSAKCNDNWIFSGADGADGVVVKTVDKLHRRTGAGGAPQTVVRYQFRRSCQWHYGSKSTVLGCQAACHQARCLRGRLILRSSAQCLYTVHTDKICGVGHRNPFQ